MNTFLLRIMAADHLFYEGQCRYLQFKTASGLYGIEAQHSDLISAIFPGMIRFVTGDGTERLAAVSQGMLKVEHGIALILVDTAERPEDINEQRARRAAEEAREEMMLKRSALEFRLAQARMARALGRLEAKRKYGKK
ncbi:MAG: ATP synthase F1 subunit epsilon [Peptoniphilaceae bacterium]|nr:ATP synthase F1 subunit epsilon [Peptoniphilaceae bacterium]MCI6660018.1 ATP synthase F1 subunit epsilon [Peptoniphilaceae bacterium]MDD7434545.1 ATP synthase F1 subunit epsilon [Peptoniphilaceae bacterium]MDY3076264.1 ATP synthase F1 subunit epsilon [Peptoniphilaceae bacterium]MDY3986909.1 ATP synthase F1 subunit epsilon [Peptoniphilaceae bacterium]